MPKKRGERRTDIEEVEMVLEPDDRNSAKTATSDNRLERWARCRDAAQYENQRMHDRFNWLMISQPVLFTALAFSVKEQRDCSLRSLELRARALRVAADGCKQLSSVLHTVELLTIGLGLTISSLVFVGLWAAGRKHWQWTSRLNELASQLNGSDERDSTVTFGSEPHWPARTTSSIAPLLALAFAGAWSYLTWVLPGDSVRWCIYGADIMMLLLVLFVPGIVSLWQWFRPWTARKRST